jgi:phage gpG-like protein
MPPRLIGPKYRKLRGRALTRNLLSQGKVRKRISKDVTIDLDVSPVWVAIADGVVQAAGTMLAVATEDAPNDPATVGSRIQESGIFGVYAFGQLIETGGSGKYRKPRSYKPAREGIDAVVSFTSGLHHLHELGTVHMPARPYLGPARMRTGPDVPGILAANFPKEGP